MQWKIALDYDAETDNFVLHINDEPYLGMPYQAEVTPEGPQNIERGTIKLNDVQVHEGWAQYTSDTVKEWREDHKLLQPTTDIYIYGFSCTSKEVVNAVVEDLGRTIDAEQGLKNLTIEVFSDENKLEEWPLAQLVLKTHHLQSLKIAGLLDTTAANKSQILEFAGLAATNSSCLHMLTIG